MKRVSASVLVVQSANIGLDLGKIGESRDFNGAILNLSPGS